MTPNGNKGSDQLNSVASQRDAESILLLEGSVLFSLRSSGSQDISLLETFLDQLVPVGRPSVPSVPSEEETWSSLVRLLPLPPDRE